MLLRFGCSNFKSIKDRQEILFTAAKGVKELDDAPHRVEGFPKHRILPAVALYGANASGKSNMLEALAFLKNAALRSHKDWDKGIDRKPFRLDPACREQPSAFDIDFLMDGARYHYGFECDDKVIREEWLYVKRHGRAERTLFHRKLGEQTRFAKEVSSQGGALERSGFVFGSALMLSFFLQSGVDFGVSIGEFFLNLRFLAPETSGQYDYYNAFSDKALRNDLETLLRQADTGIFELAMGARFGSGGGFDILTDTKHMNPAHPLHGFYLESECFPIFGRRVGISDVYFTPEDESRGTIQFLNIAMLIVLELREGGCLCIDEIDARLHTNLSKSVVQLFMQKLINPKGAQLLFTTHDTNLLSTDVLRRDQVWLTEKDTAGATHVYSLSDFDVPKNADMEKLYLEGRFGGLPYLDDFASTLRREV